MIIVKQAVNGWFIEDSYEDETVTSVISASEDSDVSNKVRLLKAIGDIVIDTHSKSAEYLHVLKAPGRRYEGINPFELYSQREKEELADFYLLLKHYAQYLPIEEAPELD